jgi:hypothetical protein
MIRNIVYIDEEKRLISYFSHSELHTIGTTHNRNYCNKTLKGIEAMNMIKKRQVNNLNYSVLNKVKYINQLFGIVV